MECRKAARHDRPRLLAGARLLTLALGFSLCLALAASADSKDPPAYPGAGHTPSSQPGWNSFQTKPDPDAPQDEAQGGKTARGTPVNKRDENSFPAEYRNVFWEVDMVPSGPGGKLEPLDYTTDGKITKAGRDAIRGQNTWMLWGGGNESFWGWLQEHNYGLADFLILLNSRDRDKRFKTAGLINQPGMKAQTEPSHELYRLLGLYLDVADGDAIWMKPPPTADAYAAPKDAYKDTDDPFKAGNPELYSKVLGLLPRDGVDPKVYGYPSGVVGLRLMPNPDFFGDTEDAEKARAYWDMRVVHAQKKDAYYTDNDINADPDLVRPFRVSMSCGFCHVAFHPLNPPSDPENPKWSNLSSTIGNQYWTPTGAFSNLAKPENFIYQFVASQQPGTIDTSLVSTDHINNANTIISVFDIPARLARARENTPENQSEANMLSPSIEDDGSQANPRHTPRVLLDGADSIGAFGALSRVYLNIGTFSQQWNLLHNPIIGFKPQRPFSVATLRANSAYWRASEKFRVPYLAAFFTHKNGNTPAGVTSPIKLADAPGGREIIESERAAATKGRDVFIGSCAICHSSKQPKGFKLGFSREWQAKPAAWPELTLPMDFGDWEHFKKSPAYERYVKAISDDQELAGEKFLKGNFLSNEIRVPVTLVGTNSGRAMATNAMSGQVWDNFSSDTYKNLPSVGAVHFYNPYSGKSTDAWGNNDAYDPPKGGPGYYRPASLISLWATAPYFHNNLLGIYNHKPSVEGRLEAFDDGIDKLLWKSKRQAKRSRRRPGGARPGVHLSYCAGDRDLVSGQVHPAADRRNRRFIRSLRRLLDRGRCRDRPRRRRLAFTAATRRLCIDSDRGAGRRHAPGDAARQSVLGALARSGDRGHRRALVVAGQSARPAARIVLLLLFVISLAGMISAEMFVNGRLGNLAVGPIPAGTPVNLIMNLESAGADRGVRRCDIGVDARNPAHPQGQSEGGQGTEGLRGGSGPSSAESQQMSGLRA